MADNRVTLPLDKVEVVARMHCKRLCPKDGGHTRNCLAPHLDERERMLDADREHGRVYGLSDDCASGKHDPVCNGTGCDCQCHPRRKP